VRRETQDIRTRIKACPEYRGGKKIEARGEKQEPRSERQRFKACPEYRGAKRIESRNKKREPRVENQETRSKNQEGRCGDSKLALSIREPRNWK